MSDTVRATEYREWAALGLEATESWEWAYVNQDEAGPDQLRGECWAARDDFRTTDGRRVIIRSSFGNDHSPGASHYTEAELYDATPEGEAEYTAAVDRWEDEPEYTAAYEARSADDDDDGDGDDDTDALPTEPADGDYVTTDYRAWHVHQGRTRFVTGADTWAAEVKAHMDAEQHWPNAWFLGERGDWNLLDLDTGTYVS